MLSNRWKVGKSMIHSMTGYGRCEMATANRKVVIELSSVNHRYLDLNIRVPRMMLYLEDSMKTVLKGKVARGKVEVTINYQTTAREDLCVTVNEALAGAYLEGLRKIATSFQLEDDLKLSDLSKLEDVVVVQKQTEHQEALNELVLKALEEALAQFIGMRQKEGTALKEDILLKSETLKEMVAHIEMRSPEVVKQYRERLKVRLGQLLDQAPVDESRLATEIALFADKCAVDEEITRLKSHIAQLQDILAKGGVVGRQLDFLMQEMNREANTIGSKANDYEMTKQVVALKTEIEKIREQVQNIE